MARLPIKPECAYELRKSGQGSCRFADFVAVSAITVAELEYGVGAAADPVERQRRRRREQLVVDTFDVIPFDITAAQSYGLLANLVRAVGRDPRPRHRPRTPAPRR